MIRKTIVAVLLTACVVGLPTPLTARTQTVQTSDTYVPTIYGSVCQANSWSSSYAPFGIYSFQASADLTMAPYALSEALEANAGGVLVGSSYYMLYRYTDGGTPKVYFFEYDEADLTGEAKQEGFCYDMSYAATDLTYNPVTKQILGCFQSAAGYRFGPVSFGKAEDVTRPTASDIALQQKLVAVATNAEGQTYAVQADGQLVRLDLTAQTVTPVGPTGVDVDADCVQSATFDPNSGKLYWAANEVTTTALYEVDPETGHATWIAWFPDAEYVSGIYIKPLDVAEGVPSMISDFALDFNVGALSGKVAFTMPADAFSGAALTEDLLDYSLRVGNRLYEGSAAPSARVSLDVTVPEAGMYDISVTVAGDAGEGPAYVAQRWIGYDQPRPVNRLTVEGDRVAGTARLTWQAVEGGMHGGIMASADMTYTVVRQPDGVTVAEGLTQTSLTDVVAPERMGRYSYEVRAVVGGIASETVTSDYVVLGPAFTTPYSHTFARQADNNLLSMQDANDDDNTWYVYSAMSDYAMIYTMKGADDWLFMPALRLEADRRYNLSFRTRAFQYILVPEEMEVRLGTAPDAASMTLEVKPTMQVSGSDWQTVEATIIVPAAGDYHIGFHATTPKDGVYLYLDDVTVTDGPMLAMPAAVADLSVKAGAAGAKQATVSFTAPTLCLDGSALSQISRIDITRADTVVKTFADVTPGAPLTYTETGLATGMHTYRVAAWLDGSHGAEAEDSTFVGIDEPLAPVQVRQRKQDGKIVLDWDAVTEGIHGGYVAPSTLTYYIMRYDQLGGQGLVGVDLTQATTYTHTIDLTGTQRYSYYFVGAIAQGDSALWGDYTLADVILVGDPYELPYSESFPEGYRTSIWDISATTQNSFSLFDSMSQDGDDGMAAFITPENGTDSIHSWLTSGMISLKGAERPALIFYYYDDCRAGARLQVEVLRDGGTGVVQDTTALWSVDLKYNPAATKADRGWRRVEVPLSDFKDEPYVYVSFHGIGVNHDLLIDNITIKDSYQHNLLAVVQAPKAIAVGEEDVVYVGVANNGSQPAADFTVKLYAGTTLVGEQTAAATLQPDSMQVYGFQIQPTLADGDMLSLLARVDYALEEFADDNTATATVRVLVPDYPVVADLTATLDGEKRACLTWTAPTLGRQVLTDGFESYQPFLIEGFGHWTTVDVDGAVGTWGITNPNAQGDIYRYDHAGEALAWQVFNPAEVGIDLTAKPHWAAHSGQQMLASFLDGRGDDQSDDWLISPVLTGEAQTVTFWIKNVGAAYTDNYEVLWSASDTARANFTRLVAAKAPSVWTKISVDLPEGALHFAIRNVSGTDGFALFVDDITYVDNSTAALQLAGFNVYRDGRQVATLPASATTYTDQETPAAGVVAYNVTVVYTAGESAFSNTASLDPTGIATLMAGDGLRLGRDGDRLVLTGADGRHVVVTTLAGQTLYSGRPQGDVQMVVPAGVYVVRADGVVRKVLVP